jgi:hypothetical protein
VAEAGLEVPVVCDGLRAAFETAYAAWPLRLFVASGPERRLALVAEPHGDEYRIEDVVDTLEKLLCPGESPGS